MTSLRARTIAGVVAPLLMVAAGARTVGGREGPVAEGSIDLETASQIVGEYARHVLTQLPRGWRQATEDEWRTDPPRLAEGGIYQLNGPTGQIAFEHDPENGQLLCWARIQKIRREYPLIGLTRDEILTALRQAAAAGVGTGGGTVEYEPISDGFFLLRAYDQRPKKVRQMARELDRLTAAADSWNRKHYLQAVLAHAETLRPPASATARDGEFEVTLVLTPDVRYHHLWHRPPGAIQPLLVSRSQYRRGQEVWAMALFSGAKAGEGGTASFEAQYSFVYPDGTEGGSEVFSLWDGPLPPEDHLQMVEKRVAIELGEDMQIGDYLARIKVCNVSTKRCGTAVSPFRVLPGVE